MIGDLIERAIAPDGPGAAVAVVEGDTVVHRAGYGLANLEWGIPAAADTVFPIASITKTFTAAAIMMLVERGQLRVDDRIIDYLPDFHTSGHDVRLHHLLTHTSGVHNSNEDPGFARLMRIERSPQEVMQAASKVPFDFAPGQRYHYCGTGYVLLGLVIERVTGQAYAEWLAQNILEPLDMRQTRLLDDRAIIPRLASGYMPGPCPAVPMSTLRLFASGGLASTVDDLVKWDIALRQGRLLSADTLARMTQPVVLNDGTTFPYGYGWGVQVYEGQPFMAHVGNLPGFSSLLARFDAFSVIVLANATGIVDPRRIAAAVARKLLGLPPVKRRPYVMVGAALDRCLGAFDLEGIPVDIIHDGTIQLRMNGRTTRLMPVDQRTLYDVDEPESTLTFDDEQDGLYRTAVLRVPFIQERKLKRRG
ncbi:MAG: serine hydrolase domain-containing protein [Chloroflexota bacterium]